MKQSLKQYNTFAVDSYTSNLASIHHITDIQNLLKHGLFNPDNFLFLGAGSNMLLLEDVPDLVIAMRMEGISYQPEASGDVVATVAAGVSWHQLVQESLSKGYNGLENLALIPGLVGAAPIQNIGAYGVEQCDRFVSLTAINMLTGDDKIFYKDECQFAYRDSFFKHNAGKYYLITSVRYRLTTKNTVCIDYKALSDAFPDQKNITSNMVFDKVCEIRTNKLPDPTLLGNAGSFFKNPVVESSKFYQLKQQFSDLIAYQQDLNQWKLAAGWLIEKAGLKGYRLGNVGVHKDQALVLVNYSNTAENCSTGPAATGAEIIAVSRYVQDKIRQIFSVELEAEVTIVGSRGVIDLRGHN